MGNPIRILLVEDHVDTAAATSRLLIMLGYLVTVAGTIAEAVALCDQNQFDLLLSDIALPDGDGCRLMEQVAKPCNIPGIAITGCAFPDDVRHSLDAGFSEHLSKPYLLDDLLGAIRRVLSNNKNAAPR